MHNLALYLEHHPTAVKRAKRCPRAFKFIRTTTDRCDVYEFVFDDVVVKASKELDVDIAHTITLGFSAGVNENQLSSFSLCVKSPVLELDDVYFSLDEDKIGSYDEFIEEFDNCCNPLTGYVMQASDMFACLRHLHELFLSGEDITCIDRTQIQSFDLNADAFLTFE